MDLVGAALDWIAANPAWAGGLLFLVALGESLALVGLFVPGAVLMVGAGALMGAGYLDFWAGAAWAVAGAISGDGISFWLGRHFGGRLDSVWPLSRYPFLLKRGVAYFRNHGGKSVLLGRFVGPLRPIIPAVAGMLEMSAARFLFFNVLSALIWAPAYLLPGLVFGASLDVASAVLIRLLLLSAMTLVVLLAGYFLLRLLYKGVSHTPVGRLLARPRRLALTVLMLLTLSGTAVVLQHQHLLAQTEQTGYISLRQWQQDPWALLPAERRGLRSPSGPFHVQWVGESQELERVLNDAGWLNPDTPGLKPLLRWLAPEPNMARLTPPLRWHNGRLPQLVAVRPLVGEQGERLVIRAWRTSLRLNESGEPIWLLSVEREKLLPGRLWVRHQSLTLTPDQLQSVTLILAYHAGASLQPERNRTFTSMAVPAIRPSGVAASAGFLGGPECGRPRSRSGPE